MNDAEFLKQKQDAVKRMMSFKGGHPAEANGIPAPDFLKFSEEKRAGEKEKTTPNFSLPLGLDFGGFPFLERLKTDKDLGLILGLILLLICENTDKLTLIALVYILL